MTNTFNATIKSSAKCFGLILGAAMGLAMTFQMSATDASAQAQCRDSISVPLHSLLFVKRDGSYSYRGNCYYSVNCIGGHFTKGSSARGIWCDRFNSKRRPVATPRCPSAGSTSRPSATTSGNGGCARRINVSFDTLVVNNFDGTYKVNGQCYQSAYCRGGKFIQGSVARFIHCKPHSNHKPSIGNYAR